MEKMGDLLSSLLELSVVYASPPHTPVIKIFFGQYITLNPIEQSLCDYHLLKILMR